MISNATSSGVLSNLDKETFINRIINKYFPDLKLDYNQGFNIKITDHLNNFIKVEDGVNFSVNYINNSTSNQQLIKNPSVSDEISEDSFDSKIDDYF